VAPARRAPIAAWANKKFLKQVTLVAILDAGYELSYLAADTLDPYFDLVDAAAAAGVTIRINSGFRSYPEQEALYQHYLKDTKNNTLAAEPGKSKHQSGVAFDIVVAGGPGNPTYDWLCANAPARGFIRTVSREPWHWEYRPAEARHLCSQGKFKLDSVNDET
jgi:LAS superfamily LD-carboxypeptidase LdcB